MLLKTESRERKRIDSIGRATHITLRLIKKSVLVAGFITEAKVSVLGAGPTGGSGFAPAPATGEAGLATAWGVATAVFFCKQDG